MLWKPHTSAICDLYKNAWLQTQPASKYDLEHHNEARNHQIYAFQRPRKDIHSHFHLTKLSEHEKIWKFEATFPDEKIKKIKKCRLISWPFLVGGWTNPIEKYARQIGNLPQGSGWKEKIFETTT